MVVRCTVCQNKWVFVLSCFTQILIVYRWKFSWIISINPSIHYDPFRAHLSPHSPSLEDISSLFWHILALLSLFHSLRKYPYLYIDNFCTSPTSFHLHSCPAYYPLFWSSNRSQVGPLCVLSSQPLHDLTVWKLDTQQVSFCLYA